MDKLTLPRMSLPSQRLDTVVFDGHAKEEAVEIVYGYELTTQGTLIPNPKNCVVGFVPLPEGCERIKWGETGGSTGYLCEYDIHGIEINWWNGSQTNGSSFNPRTIQRDTARQTKLLKATFEAAFIDYAYIIDVTHGEYIWRGKRAEGTATLEEIEKPTSSCIDSEH